MTQCSSNSAHHTPGPSVSQGIGCELHRQTALETVRKSRGYPQYCRFPLEDALGHRFFLTGCPTPEPSQCKDGEGLPGPRVDTQDIQNKRQDCRGYEEITDGHFSKKVMGCLL